MGLGQAAGAATFPVRYSCGECDTGVSIDVAIGKDYLFEEAIRHAERDLETSCGWVFDGNSTFCFGCKPDAIADPKGFPKYETAWVTWVSGVYRATLVNGRLSLEVTQDDGLNWMLIVGADSHLTAVPFHGYGMLLTDPALQGTSLRAVIRDATATVEVKRL